MKKNILSSTNKVKDNINIELDRIDRSRTIRLSNIGKTLRKPVLSEGQELNSKNIKDKPIQVNTVQFSNNPIDSKVAPVVAVPIPRTVEIKPLTAEKMDNDAIERLRDNILSSVVQSLISKNYTSDIVSQEMQKRFDAASHQLILSEVQ